VRLFYAAGGEETADLRTPKAGVSAVRISFEPEPPGRNVEVREIRVLGYAPEGADVQARGPRIALDRGHALGVARERFDEWRQGLFPGLREEVTADAEGWTVVFHGDGRPLFRVRVTKDVTTQEPLVQVVPLPS
jgi:hypothetical protein